MNSEKILLRRELRTRLSSLAPASHAAASRQLCAALATRCPDPRGQVIAAFLPLPDEPDLIHFYHHVQSGGGLLAFPRLTGPGMMEFRVVSASAPDFAQLSGGAPAPGATATSAFVAGPHGLLEPDPVVCPAVEAAAISWMLVPGLGFAAGGARLGRGGGYYDRWLAAAPPALATVGVAFSCQLLTDLSCEPHDRRVNAILTEAGWTAGAPAAPEPKT